MDWACGGAVNGEQAHSSDQWLGAVYSDDCSRRGRFLKMKVEMYDHWSVGAGRENK